MSLVKQTLDEARRVERFKKNHEELSAWIAENIVEDTKPRSVRYFLELRREDGKRTNEFQLVKIMAKNFKFERDRLKFKFYAKGKYQ